MTAPGEPIGRAPEQADVDVVILTWNDGALLERALGSVLEHGGGLVARVVVVDNASDPPAVVPDDPRIVLVRSPTNRGVAGGRNDGVAHTHAPLVCFLDSDAELRPGDLAALRAPLEADPAIAVAVPVFDDQEPNASAGALPTLRVKIDRVRGRTAHYEPASRPEGTAWWDVGFGIGACQLFRRTVFEQVDGLDERMYWTEDVDFCLRVAQHGHRVVQVADTKVLHPPRRRYRRPFTVKGARHTVAVGRFLWRARRR